MKKKILITLATLTITVCLSSDADPQFAAENSQSPLEGVSFQSERFQGWDKLRPLAPTSQALEIESYSTGKFSIPIDIEDSALEEYARVQGLPPIESYFFPLPETVCYPDERVQIVDTATQPWSPNCQLIITMRDGHRARGSGWLVSPTVVITAGHCVHEGKGGGYFESIEVVPAMNGPIRPFGSQSSLKFRASDSWTSRGDVAGDYGAILLDKPFSSANGQQPGVHAVTVATDDQLLGVELYLSGYPADKKPGSQWTDSDPVYRTVSDRLLYLIDTYGGHSGSAVMTSVQNQVVGIHNYGGCPNYATRITEEVLSDIQTWQQE